MKEDFDASVRAAQVKCLTRLFERFAKVFEHSVPNTAFRLQFGLGGFGFADEQSIQERMNLFLIGDRNNPGFVSEFLATSPENIRELVTARKSGGMRTQRPVGTEESLSAIKDWILENLYQDLPSDLRGESAPHSSIIAIPESRNS